MNWLVNRKLIKNHIVKSGLILLIPFFLGCEKANDIGIKYPLENSSEVKFEEIILPNSNLFKDSTRTENYSNIYVGVINNPVTGKVTTEGIVQPKYLRSTIPNDSLVFDSISITLKIRNTIPSNSTFDMDIDIHELVDSLESELVYLNSYKIKKKRLLGSFKRQFSSFERKDTVLMTFSFDKNHHFSKDFYSFVEKNASSIASKSYNALSFSSKTDKQACFDLSNGLSRLKIHYTSKKDKKRTYTSNFNLSTGGNYTAITRDRSNSQISNINNLDTFSLADKTSIIDPMSGIYPTASIKPLNSFFEKNKEIIVNNVLLSIEFEKNNNRDTAVSLISYFQQPNKNFYFPSEDIDLFKNLILSNQAYLRGREIAPSVSVLDKDKKLILSDITQFFQLLHNSYKTKKQLIFTTPIDKSIETKINHLVLSSKDNLTNQRTVIKKNGIKLKIYYTQLN